MGDRANIAVIQDDGKSRVYFYAHWAGSRVFRAVEAGIKVGRSDGAYLARNIFHALEAGDDSGLSFGISNQVQDNEHDIIVVHPEAGAPGANPWDGKQALIWLESYAWDSAKVRRITPKLTADQFLEVMATFDPEDQHPDDDTLARRMKAAVVVTA